ncbi:MAG TPA: helix-turn-helix domain-containing protein [Victivallales bacterium]|nr:helix-turn-helix domain-containing protein [Victivallales bacterium]
MIFKNNKFKTVRKQKRWSLSALAEFSNISRTSLSKWENGRAVPSEKKMRELAKCLNISVSQISDLTNESPVSPADISSAAESWLALANYDNNSHKDKINIIHSEVSKLDKKLKQASTIINALLSSLHCIFYIKDTDNKYIVANNLFLKNISLSTNYNVLGKKDSDLFPLNESKINSAEDSNVLINGKPVIDRENFVPGSKKKKWGIISKMPIHDSEKRMVGVIGIFVDITERKNAERRRILLEKAINNLDECIWIAKIIDINKNKYRVEYLSDAIEKISGVKKGKFLENPELWFDFIHQDYIESVTDARASKTFPRQYDYKAIRQNTGEEYWRQDTTYKYDNMFFGIAKDSGSSKQSIRDIKIIKKLYNEGINPDIISRALQVPIGDVDKIISTVK